MIPKIQPVKGLQGRRKDEAQASLLKKRQKKRKDIEDINHFMSLVNKYMMN